MGVETVVSCMSKAIDTGPDLETLLSEYNLEKSDLEHVAGSDYPLASVASTLLTQLFVLVFE